MRADIVPEVTREIRPDWDLATPGLRENWAAGDHSKQLSRHPSDPATAVS